MTTQTTLTAHGPDDLLGAVPFLLGFRPQDSLVVAVLEATTIACVARVDLADASVPDLTPHILEPMLAQVEPGAVLALVGYGRSPDAVADVVRRVAAELGRDTLLEIAVCDGAWWHVDDPSQTWPYDPAASWIAAEAAYHGLSVRSGRDELHRLFDPPRRVRKLSVATLRAAARRLDRLSSDAAQRRLGAILDSQITAGAVTLTARECGDLLVLLDMSDARDALWRRLSNQTSDILVEVFLQVVWRAPVDLALGAVSAVGLAGWQSGTGALMSVALERADRLGGWHPLWDMLARIHAAALPPSALEEIRAELVA